MSIWTDIINIIFMLHFEGFAKVSFSNLVYYIIIFCMISNKISWYNIFLKQSTNFTCLIVM